MKHKKFKTVEFNNKKRVFHLQYTSGLQLECPFSAIGLNQKVVEAGPDLEAGGHSFFYVLEDGSKDYVPYDQPLHITQHPEYVKEQALYEMTKLINQFIRKEKISKRELARRLHTSPSQLERLLDPTNHKKELSRLIEIAALLNYEFRWEFKKAI